jgi:creatinine amidohydrolase/Fe(II)-dependent formamide hydrolase-like protein
MRVVDLNWMQLEAYLESDDRIVLPLGSIEQHGYLSLGVDMILSESQSRPRSRSVCRSCRRSRTG